MNYAKYLNPVSLARKESPIRKLTEILAKSPPSMISLAAGAPSTSMFPFKEISVTLKSGRAFSLSDKLLNTSLQYLPTPGYFPLIDWLKKLQCTVHGLNANCFDRDYDLLITNGSQDALCKIFEMTLDKDSSILVDAPTYPGVLAIIQPLGASILEVPTDGEGTQPELLEKLLRNPVTADGRPATRPKLFYTCPTGCNPTGASVSLDRKRRIYQLAQEFDLLIVEDDPYYYLRFDKPKWGVSGKDSYLSMDCDGRVIRCDSFSKVLSSGMRVGFVTGPRPLTERVMLHMQASVMHASAVAQVILTEVVADWGQEGFFQHAHSVADYYRQQRDVMIEAIESSGLVKRVQFTTPQAGMFLWMQLLGVADSRALVEERARQHDVLLVPGACFLADPNGVSNFVRASYSLATPQQIRTGIERLNQVLQQSAN